MAFIVEPMRVEDIPAVMEIERQSFTMLWSAAAYRREILENRLARYLIVREVPDDLINPDCTPRHAEALAADGPASGQHGPLRQLVAGVRQILGVPVSAGADRDAVGYIGFWLMVDEAHVTTIAVHPSYRRRGVGELLLSVAIDQAAELNARVVTLEVRASNLGAQRMYEKHGFVRVGLRRRYYSDDNEDAIIMTSPEITSASYQGMFQKLKQINRDRLGRVCFWGW